MPDILSVGLVSSMQQRKGEQAYYYCDNIIKTILKQAKQYVRVCVRDRDGFEMILLMKAQTMRNFFSKTDKERLLSIEYEILFEAYLRQSTLFSLNLNSN